MLSGNGSEIGSIYVVDLMLFNFSMWLNLFIGSIKKGV